MNYPVCLGSRVTLMPAKCRNIEWFESLDSAVQNQFSKILAKFGKQVAAEYLRDNHGPSVDRWPFSPSIVPSKYPRVEGTLYSDYLAVAFEYGVYRIRTNNSPANWQYVGYVETSDRRIVKPSRDTKILLTKLRKERDVLIAQGIEVSEPIIFKLRITLAEKLREVSA